MIQQIQLNNLNKGNTRHLGNKEQVKYTTPQNQPQFTGLGEVLLGAVQACEQNPMLNVTVLDLATAILPRTFYESQTNAFAGLEAFRRESSGLIVNCLIPGFIVWGMSGLLKKPIMHGKTSMASNWADENTINLVKHHWENAECPVDLSTLDKNSQEYKDALNIKTENFYKNILTPTQGVDGSKVVQFKDADLTDSIKTYANKSINPESVDKKQIKTAFNSIAEQTHAIENVKIPMGSVNGEAKYFEGSLSNVLRDAPGIIKELADKGIHSGKELADFAGRASKLVKYKSLLGLGVIIPLAISMQPINRWITAKTSGVKGAPIYKDFKEGHQKELSKDEKGALLKQKFISVGAMVSVALLSMLKSKKAGNTIMQEAKDMGKRVTQFNGKFPTMDQARLISTATFASRMMASEDKNDLREATVRDIATFSAFYFLGDYVAKAIATAIQKFNKKGIVLINDLKPISKDANIMKKLGHWIKDTALKSSDEVVGKAAKNYRSICQLGNIGFSLLALGVLIPMITRKKTDKVHAEELKKQGISQEEINKYYGSTPQFMMNAHNSTSNKSAFNTFFTSK